MALQPSPLLRGFEQGADGEDVWNRMMPGEERGPLTLDPQGVALGQQFQAIKAGIEAQQARPIWNPDNPVGTETVQSMGMPRPTTYAGPVGQFIDPATGRMTEQGAARMENPMLGVDTGGIGGMAKTFPIYRGQMRGSEPSGSFFSEDREFARQFTHSGLDEQVITRHIDPSAVYHPPEHIYAGDEAAVDAAIAEAKKQGLSAVRLSEAKGSAPGDMEPASLFVFDKGALSRTPEARAAPALADVTKSWDALNLDHHVYENGNTITLSKIVVPESARNSGVGTQAMQQLIDYADQTGKQIALTPDKAFGATSMSRLTDFYKQLGFTPNKGRSRDFSTKETMIRNPRQPE